MLKSRSLGMAAAIALGLGGALPGAAHMDLESNGIPRFAQGLFAKPEGDRRRRYRSKTTRGGRRVNPAGTKLLRKRDRSGLGIATIR